MTQQDDLRERIARAMYADIEAQDMAGTGALRRLIDGYLDVDKTYFFASTIFALCLRTPGLTAIWTAHRAKTAKETFNSMAGMTARERVAAHIVHVARSRGDEAIIFANGSRILFGARESGFGRGFSNVSILMFDEAQILTESAMEDMVAAQNVAHNPLTNWATSSTNTAHGE